MTTVPTIPKKLAGKRVYLRPLTPADVTGRYVGWLNDTAVNRYLESRLERAQLQNVRAYVRNVRKDADSYFFAIVETATGEHIGNIKLGPVHRIHLTGDIGYLIGEKNAWGKGYATEAVLLVTAFAFRTLGLRKVTAGAYASNRGSIRVLQKAGFKKEGVRKKQYRSGRIYVDSLLFGKLNPRTNSASRSPERPSKR